MERPLRETLPISLLPQVDRVPQATQDSIPDTLPGDVKSEIKTFSVLCSWLSGAWRKHAM
jgi:hypothetical protein